MRVVIARTMPDFSMDVYADCLIAGLKSVRPEWEIVEVAPQPLIERVALGSSDSGNVYERFGIILNMCSDKRQTFFMS
jgi:hypothetical protein